MYFKKINLNFPKINYEDYVRSHFISFGKNNELNYFKLENNIEKKILASLPVRMQELNPSLFYVHTGIVNNCVAPHVDSFIKVTINYYINAAGATTVFYDLISDTIIPDYKDKVYYKEGKIFDKSIIKYHSEFTANSDDTYILNVSRIHSVESLNLPDVRKFIAIQFSNVEFEQIAPAFK